MFVLRSFALSIAALTVFSCAKAADSKPVSGIFSGAKVKKHNPISLEVVSTPGGRAQGLMYRKHLGPEEGMLFIFPSEQKLSFWMKNTLIPLDIIFIDSGWKVVGVVENAVPLTEDPRGVEGVSRYVVELAGGRAQQLGIGEGSRLTVTGDLPEPN